MMTQEQPKLTDQIRNYVREEYIEPARRQGTTTVRIVVGEVHRKLGLAGRAPTVCQALSSNIFLEGNHLKLLQREGPPSGQSTTVVFTYRILSDPDPTPAESRRSAFNQMRGIATEIFQELGGGEAFIHEERSRFYGSNQVQREPE